MNMKRITVLGLSLMMAAIGTTATAQTKSFKIGQWTEINNAILNELNRSYVDSLPLDRIEKAGIQARKPRPVHGLHPGGGQ